MRSTNDDRTELRPRLGRALLGGGPPDCESRGSASTSSSPQSCGQHAGASNGRAPRARGSIVDGLLAVVLAALLAPGLVSAQSASIGDDYTAPRTPFGHPDLQGVWSNAVITPLERPPELGDKAFLDEDEAAALETARVAAMNRDRRSDDAEQDVRNAYNDFWWDSGTQVVATRRTSLIVDPPDGRVPALTPEAEARYAALRRRGTDGPEETGLSTRCIHFSAAGPPMLPSAYNNHYQIVQTADHVLIVNEMVHETRIIPLDGRPPPAGVRQWLGVSRGRWEGETLVVETTSFTDETSLRGSGPNMRLTERFRRVADDILLYEFTVDDPESFSRPWTAQIPSVRVDALMYEYACHEGNRGLFGILAGARAAEQEGED